MFYRSSVLFGYNDFYDEHIADNGVTELVSVTNSSIQVRILAQNEDYDGWGPTAGDPLYGAGLYRASGAGDLAFYRAMRNCARGFTPVAIFDCIGGSDVTPGPPVK